MDNPGKLRKTITFYRHCEEERDELDKVFQGLKKVKTVKASVKAKSTAESFELQRLTNTVTYDIRTRYIPLLEDNSLIIFYKGKRLEIKSVVNIREENTELGFTCVEYMRAGAVYGRDEF